MSEQNTNEKKQQPPRTRYFSCIVYADPADIENDIILHEVFRSLAYIMHDKDTKEDGTPKEVHWHVLGVTPEKHTAHSISYALAHFPSNVLVEACMNRARAWDYLIHKNDADKHQYSKQDIVYEAEAKRCFHGLHADNAEFLDDLASLSMRDLAKTYGRDYMKNFRAYNDFMQTMNAEERSVAFPTAYRSHTPCERDALERQDKYLLYRIRCDHTKVFVTSSNESIPALLRSGLASRVWTDLDRIEVDKSKTTSDDYINVLSMAYVEAKEMYCI